MENAFLALSVMQWFIWICFTVLFFYCFFLQLEGMKEIVKSERVFAHDLLLLLFPKVNWKNGLWSSMARLCSHTHPPMSFLKWNVSGIAESKTPPTTMGRRIMQSWLPVRRQAKEKNSCIIPPRRHTSTHCDLF